MLVTTHIVICMTTLVCDYTIMCDNMQGDSVTTVARTVFSFDLSLLVFVLAVKIAFIMGMLSQFLNSGNSFYKAKFGLLVSWSVCL